VGLAWALDRLNDAHGAYYKIDANPAHNPPTYSILRRTPGGAWVCIRSCLDVQWALDILTVLMPRPVRKELPAPPATPEAWDELEAASLIRDFYAVVKYRDRDQEAGEVDDEVCISLQSEERDHAARLIEGDCGLPFAYFPGQTEAQVRLSHSRDNSPEAWYIADCGEDL
jgi:hypothetical protein